MDRKRKVNDLFCGAGGMGLGFLQAGYKIAGAWDFDKHAVKSYAHNIGDHVKQMDITTMSWNDMPKADVWTFGFPCQDLSVASGGQGVGIVLQCTNQACGHEFQPYVLLDAEEGDQAGVTKCPECGSGGKSASRSALFFEVMRLLDETKENAPENMPPAIVAENVPRLKPYLPVLEAEYAKRGYKMYAQLFNSKYWGVPQDRKRYFVVGLRADINGFRFPDENKDAHIPALSSVLVSSPVDAKYYVPDDRARIIIDQAQQKVALEDVHACLTPGRVERRQQGPRARENESPMFTLTSQDLHGVIYRGRGVEVMGDMGHYANDQMNRVYDPAGVSPTVMTCSGGGRHVKVFDYGCFRVRRLIPEEYRRLQGFPETWEQVVSDSQAYKQFGNAVTTYVAQAVAEAVKAVLPV